MPVVNLTNEFLKSLNVIPGTRRTEWVDRSLSGFYIEARATSPNKGTYYLRYKNTGGTTRHMRLGSTDTMTLAEARAEAKKRKAEIQLGSYPGRESKYQEQSISYGEFVEKHYLPHSKLTKRSYRDDFNRTHQRLIPRWGLIPMNEITTRMIVELQHELKESGLAGSTCDRFVSLLKHQFRLACEWDFLKESPAKNVKLYREPNEVNHYLDEDQLKRLLNTLYTHRNRLVCNLVLLLLGTAVRLNEALKSRWEDIDIVKRLWRIEATNSKNKRVRAVPLSDFAISVLEAIQPDAANRHGYVFVSPRTGSYLKSPGKGWNSIRNQAELPFFRLHDCRHMAASLMINSGRSLFEVQQLLGHQNVQTSMRYSHLSTEVLQDAANTVSDRLLDASPKLLPALPSSDSEAA